MLKILTTSLVLSALIASPSIAGECAHSHHVPVHPVTIMSPVGNSNYGGVNNTSYNRSIDCQGFNGDKEYYDPGKTTRVTYVCGKETSRTAKLSAPSRAEVPAELYETIPVAVDAIDHPPTDTNFIRGRG